MTRRVTVARMARMAMTMRSSMRVKAALARKRGIKGVLKFKFTGILLSLSLSLSLARNIF